jgi:hypothetical protein
MTSTTNSGITAWLGQRLPEAWRAPAAPADPAVSVDREEITVVLALPAPEPGVDDAATAEAAAGAIARFRAETKAERIGIAREAEHRFGRKVAWGVTAGERRELFTHLAVPVMTRLEQPERQVLDTLVDAGVARSRAHALAWCVRLVGRNTESWLADLREAMSHVEKVRDTGPGAAGGSAQDAEE